MQLTPEGVEELKGNIIKALRNFAVSAVANAL
jgi:hypothetical protein